ncbi:amidohydrolase family protein [Aspergillus steynii IBT 23096]|uniref:Amidohydrolase family protein n=1 Tax=Aspergillus steynii IBT 23096 TaxID=1392250 RepID=A0A2I2G6V9_9EURO|nr:amidohydrolase family protein [Aspergillus steynii IBT 23096]PLB48619.1 amidohydrolase family protein [Aspergillus steynii IBT 23096]
MEITVFTNGRIHTNGDSSDEPIFQQAMVIVGHRIVHVGTSVDDAVQDALSSGAKHIDLQNRIVVPGFIDSHIHMIDFALSRRKLDLLHCKSLDDIRHKIKAYAETHPSEPRIACKSWIQSTTDGVALASMLDDLDPRPIYIQANDLHSGWCNTAALEEIGATAMTDPPGGKIHRDDNGRPTGLLSETAYLAVVPPFLMNAASKEDKLAALEDAAAAYSAAGYTGMIDMAMDDVQWDVLKTFRQKCGDNFPFHVAAHWLVPYSHAMDEVFRHLDTAIARNREYSPVECPEFCIVGIKLMSDGVVDGCTAALKEPYNGATDRVPTIWPADALEAVIKKADSSGLQCAVHAIGDQAVKQAIDGLSQGQPTRRHRIEHLELTTPEDAKRLGQQGITASVQPVHSDPVLFRAWPDLIGQHRCSRAFAYRDFLDGGAPIAIGTDAPTAAHLSLPNLYNATTRRSTIEPGCEERVNSHFGLSLGAAVTAATTGAAYSRFAESWTGMLRKGYRADFVVLDMEWKAESLLKAKVRQTWARGKKSYDAGTDD